MAQGVGPLKQTSVGTPAPESVCVHQVGKVASQTVFHALKSQVSVPVFQTHVVHPKTRYFVEDNPAPPPGHDTLPPHIIRAREFVRDYLLPRKPYAVISMVRDPVARNASAFFQNLGRYPHLASGGGFAPVDEFIWMFHSEWPHEEVDV